MSLDKLGRNQAASPDKWMLVVMHPYYPAWSMCLVRGPVVHKPWWQHVYMKEHGVCLHHAGLCSCNQGRILLDEICLLLSSGESVLEEWKAQ